ELVEHAAWLERAGALEELRLQVDVGADGLAERARREQRRPVEPPCDALAGAADVVEREERLGHGHAVDLTRRTRSRRRRRRRLADHRRITPSICPWRSPRGRRAPPRPAVNRV